MAAGDNTLLTFNEWIFRSGAYVPTGNNVLTEAVSPTGVSFSMNAGGSGIAVDGARGSAKVDLLTNRPLWIDCWAAVEWFSAVAAGGFLGLWWSPSASSTAAAGNPGRPSGADSDYTGDGGGTVDESVLQMQRIGTFKTTSFIGVQMSYVGSFSPRSRWGTLVMVNKSSAALCSTDDIESAVLFYGTIANSE